MFQTSACSDFTSRLQSECVSDLPLVKLHKQVQFEVGFQHELVVTAQVGFPIGLL